MHRKPKSLFWKMTVGAVLSVILFALGCFIYVGIITYQNSIIPQGIVVHHSALPPEYQVNKPADIQIIADFHRERGFEVYYWGKRYNIGYHYVILPDGTVVAGRPERCHGAHAKNFNSHIGIVLIGNFSEQDENGNNKTPTAEQMKSLVTLATDIRRRYRISIENIVPHRDVKTETECPGKNFPMSAFLAQIRGESQ